MVNEMAVAWLSSEYDSTTIIIFIYLFIYFNLQSGFN